MLLARVPCGHSRRGEIWEEEASPLRHSSNVDRNLCLLCHGQRWAGHSTLGGFCLHLRDLPLFWMVVAPCVGSRRSADEEPGTNNSARPWLIGAELCPVRYRHVGSAMNAFTNVRRVEPLCYRT